MGSASGRRKCCQSFFDRGYEIGYASQPKGTLCDPYMAGTVSKSFKGLFRIGFDWGWRDSKTGKPKRPHAYDNYCCQRDRRQPVLDHMDDGFTLAYAPRGNWPQHPFTLTSGGGGIIYRRSRSDLEPIQDAPFHRVAIVTVLREQISAETKRRARMDTTSNNYTRQK